MINFLNVLMTYCKVDIYYMVSDSHLECSVCCVWNGNDDGSLAIGHHLEMEGSRERQKTYTDGTYMQRGLFTGGF